jgi:sarcosine oxidase
MSGLDADVVVLGLGAVGSATLHALAARGVRAIGVERYGRAHEWGSHHGHTRVFRHAYFEHPDYVPMLLDSTARVYRLQEAVGEALQERCGVLVVGEPGSVLVEQSGASAARFGVPVEWLDSASLTRRFPQFAVGPETRGLFEPDGGFLRPEAIIRAQLKRAEALGAQVRTDTTVLGWDEDEHGVRVRVDGGDLRAAGLVVAAGAWTTALVPSLAPLLRVSREMQGWLQPSQPALAQPDRLPCWLVDRVGQRALYGIPVDPLRPGPPLAKVAVHGGGKPVDVADVDRVVGDSELAALQQAAGETLPGLPGRVEGAKVCLYTNTPDEDFILDRVPGSRRAWVAAGMSGHGFKLAPALGAALADLVTAGRTDQPVGFLGLSRFS